MTVRRILTLLAIAAAGLAVYVLAGTGSNRTPTGEAMVSVLVPDLTGDAVAGADLFRANCEACHGVNGAGRDGLGPPLVHEIYEPGHHGDAAFSLAVRRGVKAHHWRFGDMPAVEGVGETDVGKIIAYVRALQRANGIN